MLRRDLLEDAFSLFRPQIALRVLIAVFLQNGIVLDRDLDAARHRCLAVLMIDSLASRAVLQALSQLEYLLKTRL